VIVLLLQSCIIDAVDEVKCGAGTHLSEGVCEVDEGDSASDTNTDSDVDSDSGGDTDADSGGEDTDVDSGVEPVDADGDGFAMDEDCDDTDATVNPGADELWYDGTDQNCDGRDDDQDGDGLVRAVDCDDIDASTGAAPSWYYDGDGDGFGDPATAVSACSQPAGYGPDDSDCDDSNAAKNPDAVEVWGDGDDNNCDGSTDDDASIEGTYTGTSDGTVSDSGYGSCYAYYGTASCTGSASAEAFTGSGSAILAGDFSCTIPQTYSCWGGDTLTGTFTVQSTGGTAFSGDVYTDGGACSGYIYDGSGTISGAVDATGLTLAFGLYTCALPWSSEVAYVSVVISVAR
jgi:Putative metal-binding motif